LRLGPRGRHHKGEEGSVADKVRIGIVGTSWWADAMYLPPLSRHPLADVRAIVGGSRPDHTREFAAKWNIPNAYDTLDEMPSSWTLLSS
jgi:predicted dehydrogenase